jgi:hypothetical protein
MLQPVALCFGFLLALREMVASPGNAPGHQGYEPRVESSRLAVWNCDFVSLKWSRWQDLHLLSRTSKVRSSTPLPSSRSCCLKLVEAAGVAPATRCLQGSVAPPAHAPPFQILVTRGQISETVDKSAPCSLPSNRGKIVARRPGAAPGMLVLDCVGAKRS